MGDKGLHIDLTSRYQLQCYRVTEEMDVHAPYGLLLYSRYYI